MADVIGIGARFSVSVATAEDLPEAQALAARLMAHKVADLDVYLRVQSIQPVAVMVAKEEGRITAVTAMLFLRAAAVDQFAADAFDALDPDGALLTVEGESPAAVYSWGVAAATKPGGAAVLGAGMAIREELFPYITALSRAVTGAGRHVAMTRYGYRPLRHADDELMVAEFRPPLAAEKAA